MFRLHKTLDVITLFHKAGSPASMKVASLLKQASAAAVSGATEDQASDHSAQTKKQEQREEFELNITEEPPTADQVQTIIEYLGASKVSSVFRDASSADAALKQFKKNPNSFERPVVVDWNNGRAIAGDNESEILKMLSELKK